MNRSYGDTLQTLSPQEIEGYGDIGGMSRWRRGSARTRPRRAHPGDWGEGYSGDRASWQAGDGVHDSPASHFRPRIRSDYYLGWHEPMRDGEHAAEYGPQGTPSGADRAAQRPWSHDPGRNAAFRKGPKGYVRSDEHLRDDVCERLYRCPRVDVSEVSVEVDHGTVSLQGGVPERQMKHAIEDIVAQCFGVREIDNRIRVMRGSLESWSHNDTPRAATDPSPTVDGEASNPRSNARP